MESGEIDAAALSAVLILRGKGQEPFEPGLVSSRRHLAAEGREHTNLIQTHTQDERTSASQISCIGHGHSYINEDPTHHKTILVLECDPSRLREVSDLQVCPGDIGGTRHMVCRTPTPDQSNGRS
jgi:hypothetical protein